MRWALLGALLFAGCVLPAPYAAAPTLAELAHAEPDGARRASLNLTVEAEAELEAGESERARGLAERALRVDGRNPYAYYLLARLALQRGELRAARRDLGQAEALLGADAPGWRGRFAQLRREIDARSVPR